MKWKMTMMIVIVMMMVCNILVYVADEIVLVLVSLIVTVRPGFCYHCIQS